MRIVALAGGVGGAKLAHGLAQVLPPEDLTIIVNTGDDFEHLGMRISPDLDTVCYTLAGLANPDTGWGRAAESWHALTELQQLGGPTWFRIGDRDLATHLERTRRLSAGQSLSLIVHDFCRAWGVQQTVLPMTNASVRTMVQTDTGELAFQEYFVRQRCEPRVRGFRFDGVEDARAAPGAIEAVLAADAVIICPSNPWVSIGPILAIQDVRAAIASKAAVAVSPIVGGKAIKGPADKMFRELGLDPTAAAVAQFYVSLVGSFVMDRVDAQLEPQVRGLGMRVLLTQTLMRTEDDRRVLARDVLDFARIHKP